MDSPKLDAAAENFRQLGIRELYPISAEHGAGVAELLDAVLEALPEKKRITEETEVTEEASDAETDAAAAAGVAVERETRIAIIGRPNVGKSTLLNQLTRSARAIVSPVPGTTRDAVDEMVEHDGKRLRFIDTAGIRRKGKTHLMAEKLAVVMARKHLEAADIALMIIDATEGVTSTDATIAGYAHESGRSIIVVINKWDLVTTNRRDGKPPAERELFEQQARRALKFLNYAPILFVSATEGKGIGKVFSTLETVESERRK